jgi:hypothetical protein
MSAPVNQNDLISYGPDANCVLDMSSPYYCPASASVYAYRPSLPANIIFLIIFFLFLAVEAVRGFRWRTWWFSGAMIFGFICEILGYGGRIMLWINPFSFNGFMLQITTITLGPAFFSAAIYFTLAKIIVYVGREYSRIPPKAYYYIFIPCDLISLSLQGTGGGLSSSSSGGSNVAVDVSIAGLSFQVVTLCVFIALATDYAIRAAKGRKRAGSETTVPLSRSFKIFVFFLAAAIVFILIRCGYRIAELKGGYTGPGSDIIREEAPFIALESVMIILAATCLAIAHPGPVFQEKSGGVEQTQVETKA